MCGRFTLRADGDALRAHFRLDRGAASGAEARPRYNIAPTQAIAVVRWNAAAQRRELVTQRWGLVPRWAAQAPPGAARPTGYINARAETLATKPAFREAFRQRRCLIPADGFYEWAPNGPRRQPWFIHRGDDGLFAFAGLWEEAATGGEAALASCTIITRAPLAALAALHDRMPAILAPADYATWLDPGVTDPEQLGAALSARALGLEIYPVTEQVNRPGSDGPECLQPLASPRAC